MHNARKIVKTNPCGSGPSSEIMGSPFPLFRRFLWSR